MRAALGKEHLRLVAQAEKRMLLIVTFVHAWWLAILATLIFSRGAVQTAAAIMALVLLPVLAMSWRSRSLQIGLYSVTVWQINALGFWSGLLGRRIPPGDWIASVVVHDGSKKSEPAAQKETHSPAG